MKILWLSPRWPIPADTGGRKATLALLEEIIPAAERLNKKIELNIACMYEETPSAATIFEFESRTQTKNNLYLQKRPLSYISSLLKANGKPFTIAKCTSPAIESIFTKWAADQSWDMTVVDGPHGAAFVNLTDKRFGQIIYRAHNVETDIWEQLYEKEKNPLKRLVFKKEYELTKTFEKNLCQISSKTLTVSEHDASRFFKLGFTQRVQALPIGMKINSDILPFGSGQKLNLLFVGRLDWLPNKEGLIWFLNEIWPVVKSENLTLTIVGSGDSRWLSAYESANVSVHRNAPELKAFYQKAHVTLIPLFMGSGTRVKAIESGAYGRSFISTKLGAEGLPFVPGRDYWMAETKAEWIATLHSLSLKEAQEKAASLHGLTQSIFDQKNLAEKFLTALLGKDLWVETSAI